MARCRPTRPSRAVALGLPAMSSGSRACGVVSSRITSPTLRSSSSLTVMEAWPSTPVTSRVVGSMPPRHSSPGMGVGLRAR
jgi:hypothetical protein